MFRINCIICINGEHVFLYYFWILDTDLLVTKRYIQTHHWSISLLCFVSSFFFGLVLFFFFSVFIYLCFFSLLFCFGCNGKPIKFYVTYCVSSLNSIILLSKQYVQDISVASIAHRNKRKHTRLCAPGLENVQTTENGSYFLILKNNMSSAKCSS